MSKDFHLAYLKLNNISMYLSNNDLIIKSKINNIEKLLYNMKGDIWYGKYGFIPMLYDNNMTKINNEEYIKYKNNKDIMNKTILSDVKNKC